MTVQQQILMAENAAAPPPSGFDSSMLSNRTFVFSMDQSAIYKGLSTDNGLATADMDDVQRIDSGPGPSTIRTFAHGFGPGRFRRRNGWYGTGLDAVQNQAAANMDLYTRPTGNATPTAAGAMSTLFAAGAKTLIFAGTIHDAPADSGVVYGNASVLSEGGGYLGLHYYKSGSNAILQWYNYAAGEMIRTATVPLGVPFVVACRHASSTLGVSVNNGAWTTTGSSGNTADMTSQARLMYGATANSLEFAILVTCNANNSDANIAACCTSAGTMIGLTI